LKAVDEIPEVPEVAGCATADIPVPEAVGFPADFGLSNLDGEWSPDEAVGESFLSSSSVDEMLASSIKPSTARKYGRIWDKWAVFTASHEVQILPPEYYARMRERERCLL
jgi:hypothetical protein